MTEEQKVLSVRDLLTKDNYEIPLYQRNFSWTYDEIEQLIRDVADTFKEEHRDYYIGTLVVNKRKNDFEIIDGQQRITALTLIALVLKNKYHQSFLTEVNLQFPARKRSNQSLKLLFEGGEIDRNDELIRGYHNAEIAMSKILDDFELVTSLVDFFNFLLDNVKIFRSILPDGLDMNLYFERFNSRGEQLESHEILKAEMMAKLDKENATKFAKIWDACSEFDKPVISSFTKKERPGHNNQERELIFSEYYNQYVIENLYDKVTTKIENKYSIFDELSGNSSATEAVSEQDDEKATSYRTIIDFNTFLYLSLFITNKQDRDIQFDDKKLLKSFNLFEKDSHWVMKFSETMLQLKFIFDNFIIKSLNDDTENGTNWVLRKATRQDTNNNRSRGWKYVYTRYENNTFSKDINDNIIMLQSMFAVTFTSNRDSKWLYDVMVFLLQNANRLHEETFGNEFIAMLEELAITNATSRIFKEDTHIFKSYTEGIPVYAFNFVDYVLWKNRSELKDKFFNVEKFSFRYRRSIEHWYPQNPNEAETGLDRMSDEFLHAFGNLCIITDSQNSKFGNYVPSAKYDQWEKRFMDQSLKLQWMAHETKGENHNWNEESIERMEEEISRYVNNFMEEGNQ